MPKYDGRLNALSDRQIYSKSVQNRLAYNDIINQCIDHQLDDHYSLMASSEVQYCDERKTSKDIGLNLKLILKPISRLLYF